MEAIRVGFSSRYVVQAGLIRVETLPFIVGGDLDCNGKIFSSVMIVFLKLRCVVVVGR